MHKYVFPQIFNFLFSWAGQISEELEHRIGLMETSLSRFGMILDSVQSDVMQVNKGTKEVSLESEYSIPTVNTLKSRIWKETIYLNL